MKKNYSVVKVLNRLHVVCSINDRLLVPNPNYRGTGKALHAIVPIDKTFEEWLEENTKIMLERNKI